MASEKLLEEDIIKYIKGRGGIAEHLAGNKGDRDLVCCYRGRYIALEVKAWSTYYKATKLQQAKLQILKRAGAITSVVNCIDNVKIILDTIDKVLEG